MTIEEALEEIPDINTFCRHCCDRCTTNDWYCPSTAICLKRQENLILTVFLNVMQGMTAI